MSFAVIERCLALNLPLTEKAILIVLADKAGKDGRRIYPSIDRVAAEAGCYWRTVDEVMRKLEARGILLREWQPPRGSKKPVHYRIDLETVERLIATDPIKVDRRPRGKGRSSKQTDSDASVTSERMQSQTPQLHETAVISNTTPQSSVTPDVTKPRIEPVLEPSRTRGAPVIEDLRARNQAQIQRQREQQQAELERLSRLASNMTGRQQ